MIMHYKKTIMKYWLMVIKNRIQKQNKKIISYLYFESLIKSFKKLELYTKKSQLENKKLNKLKDFQ